VEIVCKLNRDKKIMKNIVKAIVKYFILIFLRIIDKRKAANKFKKIATYIA
jgi:hypothetical protein